MSLKRSSQVFSTLFFLCFFVFSCKTDCTEIIDTSNISIDVDLVRLEQHCQTPKNLDDAKVFLKTYKKFTAFNLQAGKPEQQLLSEVLWLSKAPIDTLLRDVEKQYGDFATEKNDLTNLFKHIKSFYPNFKVPEVNTMVSAFGGYIIEDGEDVLLIGLDYFLDSTATYSPPRQEIPDYMKKHLQKDKIATKSAYHISNRFIASNDASQLVNQMITFGKRYYFAHRMLPCKAENEILDYTPEEWQAIITHKYDTYSYFTKNELFYNTKPENYRLLLGDSPKCPAVGDNCPGRIGRWLGYELVKAYVKNNDVSLQELMSETNHIKIFTQSGYKPEKS